jgi:hypothetical protein
VLVNEINAFMSQNGNQLGFVLQSGNQSEIDVDTAVGHGKGVEYRRFEDVNPHMPFKLGIESIQDRLEVAAQLRIVVDLAAFAKAFLHLHGGVPQPPLALGIRPNLISGVERLGKSASRNPLACCRRPLC